MRRCSKIAIAAAWLLASASHAAASTQINGLFDARSHAMGSTGAACKAALRSVQRMT